MDRTDRDTHRMAVDRPVCWAAVLRWACGVLLCGGAAVDGGTVRLVPAARVQQREVHLGDVATIEGFDSAGQERLEGVLLSAAPPLGEPLQLTADQVRERLRETGVNMAFVLLKGASVCVVHRQDRGGSGAVRAAADGDGPRPTLGDCVRQAITARLADYGGELLLDIDPRFQDLLELSEPRHTFQIRFRSDRRLGPLDLQLAICPAGQDCRTQRLVVQASLRKAVVVASTNLQRGTVIGADDVTLEPRVFNRLGQIGVSDPAAVIGQEARRAMHLGDMITSGDLKSRVLVRSNELVRVRSMGDGMVLQNAARALDCGGLGDVIEVKNDDSNDAFWVRITGLRQAQALTGSAALAGGESGETP